MRITTFKIRLNENFLTEDKALLNEFLQNNHILETTSQFVHDKEHFWSILLRYSEKNMFVNEPVSKKYETPKDEVLNSDEITMLESLKLWRNEKAKEKNMPPYVIANNKELVSLVKFKPATKEELLEVKGFGKYRIENFGDDIISVLETL